MFKTMVAKSTPFDNSTNGFTATEVQSALEELSTLGVFGQNVNYAEANAETSTNSKVTFLNKITLTTPSLPLGDYLCSFQFIWRASNANRALDVRVQRGGSDLLEWLPFTASLDDRQLICGFSKAASISGVNTFTLDFKVGGTGTTVYMKSARMFVWRIA